ncbi:MAG: glycosyltransferase family 1 protein [Fusobacterium sp.]|mgnify:CR=1 FL=1|uniref:glycosyltransferase family 1 protein n=1 Tax=Fusobacterium sp. TaxID=68766 RepID=UPI002A74BA33|nr:glycosyltransferase family 1 protein [Fusobacterium sp.]MDY3060765.1 glycosyltransferase family 1 protein [Fusobacterium sp.]
MREEPIRILQITGGMNMGGIENFIMNIYRNIGRDRVQFDFLIHQEEKQIFEDEIISLGGKVFRIPSLGKVGHFKYIKGLREFFQSHQEYKIVHSHYNTISGIILREAKKCGIKVKIAHSHTSYPKYRFIESIYKNYSKNLINRNTEERYACSQKAGEWLYGKIENFKVINNGIDPKEYKFNERIRKNIRNELKTKDNEILIGHVGRFSPEKNHEFIIDVFKELYSKNNKYRLVLVGTGDTEDKIKEKVKNLNLQEVINFLGVRKDVKNLLQGFDIFLLPSIFEGLPVTLVEAQGAGLKCFISDTVTKEIDLECGLTEFISLGKASKEWAEIIDKNREYIRKDTIDSLRVHGYDMTENAKNLENRYIELYNKV